VKWRAFETRAPGKWVLAGEHAVLRGHEALALPHPDRGLSLRFEPSDATASAPLVIHPSEAETVIGEMLASIPEILDRAGSLPSGALNVASSVPVGAGLGSSAALCVAVTRWLAGPLGLADGELAEFATRLENRFHGQSSGMDIAVILAEAPVRFTRGGAVRCLGRGPLPRFTFHDTGLRASTRDCIARVEALGQSDSKEALRLDSLMGKATEEGARGLELFASGDLVAGLNGVARAMELSHECFEAWGLLSLDARRLRQELLSQGALGAKLTGAGGGGFVVALWND
jgi:mevalonate kinase